MFSFFTVDINKLQFPIELHFFKIIGIWPTNFAQISKENQPILTLSNLKLIFYTAWSIFGTTICVLAMIGQSIYLASHMDDEHIFGQSGPCTFAGWLATIRIIYFHLYRSKFRILLQEFISNIWISTKTPYKHIKESSQRKLIVFHIMSTSYVILFSLFVINPIFEYSSKASDESRVKPLPFLLYLPYDVQPILRYIITWILSLIVILLSITSFISIDTIFGLFIIYTCGQFDILNESIDNIIPSSYIKAASCSYDKESEIKYFQQHCLENLNQIIKKHNTLIRFVHELESFFDLVILINFLFSTVIICIIGFQLIIGKEILLSEYIKYIVFAVSISSQLFLICWSGEILVTKSTSVTQHLYNCNWEGWEIPSTNNKMSSHFRRTLNPSNIVSIYPTGNEFCKNIQIMIMYSQEPLALTAFKFSILSLQSFTILIKTSMSYLALLQSVYSSE